MAGLKLTEQDVLCCSPLLSAAPAHHRAITSSSPQHHIPTPHPAIARGKNASFSFNTKIRMLSRTTICQVPLASQLFHFALWIHTLRPLMIKSLERMGGRRRYFLFLFGAEQPLAFGLIGCSPWLCNYNVTHAAGNSKYRSPFTRQVLAALGICECRLEVLRLVSRTTWQEHEVFMQLILTAVWSVFSFFSSRRRYRWSLCAPGVNGVRYSEFMLHIFVYFY